jgi:hypothetical protein
MDKISAVFGLLSIHKSYWIIFGNRAERAIAPLFFLDKTAVLG